ncbi:MAG: hypothetical protein U0704_12520 [Candidatus Eisenbacteria bacterium]
MDDAVFARVKLDTFEDCEASPALPSEDFKGIVIAMPARVPVSRVDRVPLCGTWRLPGKVVASLPGVEDSLVYLVRDVETHAAFSGHFRYHEDVAEPTPDPADAPGRAHPSGLPVLGAESMVMKGWFNFNLGRAWKIPRQPGRYRVVVTLQHLQSNEVEFEVTK